MQKSSPSSPLIHCTRSVKSSSAEIQDTESCKGVQVEMAAGSKSKRSTNREKTWCIFSCQQRSTTAIHCPFSAQCCHMPPEIAAGFGSQLEACALPTLSNLFPSLPVFVKSDKTCPILILSAFPKSGSDGRSTDRRMQPLVCL